MQEFTFRGPIEIGDEKQHVIRVQVIAIPDDESNLDLVKACGIVEKESRDILQFTMTLRDKLMREYLDGQKTDTIDTGGEAN